MLNLKYRTDAYIHDNDGNLLETHHVSEAETVKAAEEMVNFLKENEGIGTPEAPFVICDGELKRSLICCCNGAREPLKSSPEYFKQYKPENNSGCCGGCQNKETKTVKKRIKRGCFVRYKVSS
jgi:hypothetical protein